MPQDPRIVVTADDLTGAADAGVQFTLAGIAARVWLRDGTVEAGASVFDTESRSLDPPSAAGRVGGLAGRLGAIGFDHFYQKVDSTLRGNLGAETAALLTALGRAFAVLAPAFPANGRTTLGGVQLVRGVPVHQTAIGRDPAHPMRFPTIAAALRSQSDLPVVEIGLDEVRRGPGRLAAALELAAGGRPVIAVVDAERDDDLAALAAALAVLGPRCLPVGSAGLAAHMPAAWGLLSGWSARPLAPSLLRRAERVLFVCGSLNPATGAQVEALARARGVEPLAASARGAGRRAAAALAAGTGLLCSGAARDADPARVAARLGRRAREAVASLRPDALVLTGGDTARAVLDALGGRGIALQAELLPGVPLGRIVGGELDGVTVVTKAGGFGGPDTLVEVQRYLQEATR
ncbi:MAG TPA: four-carbon acid sugar kinase family protein [Chloroflexota bacterium]|jgi:uncharacterized protein YgbK (DUF1537 family)